MRLFFSFIINFFPSGDFFNPFFTFQAEDAPYGFYNLIEFEAEVDPKGRPLEDKAGEDSGGDGNYPKENVVSNHEHFGVAAATENALCHNAVCGLENYNKAD